LKLADKAYLHTLLNTGLDHLLFLLQPENEASWRALETIMPEDMFTTAHITVNEKTLAKMDEILQKLADLQVTSLSLGLADIAFHDRMDEVRDKAANLGLQLAFDLPVPYSMDNPVALETAHDDVPSGAGKSWLYVEPDGDVLPAQGMAGQVLGNLLRDPWNTPISHNRYVILLAPVLQAGWLPAPERSGPVDDSGDMECNQIS
jgi:hypothetical protein